MSSIGINFRSTAGYVTDPAGTTYCIGDTYPTTRGGWTFGWVSGSGPGSNLRDRNNSIDPRLAGINFHSGSFTLKFRIDLPASGSYNVRCAMGDAGAQNGTELTIFDNTTSLGELVTNHLPNSGNFYDATNTVYSAANWPGSNSAASLTFSTTTFFATINSSYSFETIAHLYVEQAAGGGFSPAFRRTLSQFGTGAGKRQIHAN